MYQQYKDVIILIFQLKLTKWRVKIQISRNADNSATLTTNEDCIVARTKLTRPIAVGAQDIYIYCHATEFPPISDNALLTRRGQRSVGATCRRLTLAVLPVPRRDHHEKPRHHAFFNPVTKKNHSLHLAMYQK